MPSVKLPLVTGPARTRVAPDGRLDCVLIGPHIDPLADLIERARPTRGASAFYDDAILSSVLVGGRRLSYVDLLNRALERATGRPHALSPFLQPSGALCYLTSFLRRRGFSTESVNFFTFEQEKLRAQLARNPRAVAITTTFYVETEPLADVVRFVRAHAPEAKIVVGGPWVYRTCSNFDELTQDYLLQDIGADFYVFDSQGESSLAALLGALRTGDVRAVPNLIFTRDNQTFERTPRAPESNDLDENAIDWSLFELDYIRPTVYLRTARSCPFACTFCGYPIAAGEHVLNDVDVIVAQLRWLKEHGVENIVFVDDTFNVPLPRFKTLLRKMIDERLGLRWMSFLRPTNADAEAIELMGKSGCAMTFLGVESANPELLVNMDKYARVEKFKEGIARLHDQGIYTHCSFIVGFPGETQKTIDTTMEFIESTRPTTWMGQIFYHDPRTPLEARKHEFALEGTGFAWQHATANWQDAVRWAQQMVREVRGSEPIGGYALGPWGTFYLLTLGYSMDQIRAFLRVTRDMVIEGLDEREGSSEDALVSIVRAPVENAI